MLHSYILTIDPNTLLFYKNIPIIGELMLFELINEYGFIPDDLIYDGPNGQVYQFFSKHPLSAN